jgi:hypothetical protein
MDSPKETQEFTKLTVTKEVCALIDIAIRGADSGLSRVQFAEAVLRDACDAVEKKDPMNALRTINRLRHLKHFPLLVGKPEQSIQEKIQEALLHREALLADAEQIEQALAPYVKTKPITRKPKI